MYTSVHNLNAPSASSPPKRPSSQKIDLLYQEFQNLKARIHKSTQKKKDCQMPNSSMILGQLNQRNNSFLLKEQNYRSHHHISNDDHQVKIEGQLFKTADEPAKKISKEVTQSKYLIDKVTQTIYSHYSKFEKEITTKIENYERKAKAYEETIKKLGSIISIKSLRRLKDLELKEMPSISLKECESESLGSVIMQYERKISILIEDYEQKIQIAQENDKDKATYSSTIKDKEFNSYEKEILQKDTEINKMRLSYHRLKRQCEQVKDKYDNCLIRLGQLEMMRNMRPSLKDKSIQLEDQDYGKIAALEQDIINMKRTIQLRDNEIQRLKDQLHSLKSSSKPMQLPQFPLQTEPLAQIAQRHEDRSDKNEQIYTELFDIQADPNFLDEFYTKSQIIQPKRKKEMFKNLRNLEMQVNLMSQQNKHLKSKKDILQTIAKNSELDEQRFQQQSAIMKSQVKRLNQSVQKLDGLISDYLKNGSVDPSKIEELPQQMKCKALFLKSKSKSKK